MFSKTPVPWVWTDGPSKGRECVENENMLWVKVIFLLNSVGSDDKFDYDNEPPHERLLSHYRERRKITTNSCQV